MTDTLPPLPILPQSLLNTIGKYGMARSDKCMPIEITNRWQLLIQGIKEYARDYALAAMQQGERPIDMVLFCPKCGKQHVDAPDDRDCDKVRLEIHRAVNSLRKPTPNIWTNPPHRSHLCHGCGHIWRPADVPPNGVQEVKTKGKADSPIAQPVQPEAEPAKQRFNNVKYGGCPVCGLSGCIASSCTKTAPAAASYPADQEAARPALSDEQIDKAWRSVDYTQPYDQFRMAVGRAIEQAVRGDTQWQPLPQPPEPTK